MIFRSCESHHRPHEESYNEKECQGVLLVGGEWSCRYSTICVVSNRSTDDAPPFHIGLSSLFGHDVRIYYRWIQIALVEDRLKCFFWFHHRQMSHSSESRDDRLGECLDYEQSETEE